MRIGFDISALSAPQSGVGRYQVQLLKNMIRIGREHFFELYGFNLRNRSRFETLGLAGNNIRQNIVPIPQRLVTLWWMLFSHPSLDFFVPGCDLYHISEICFQPVKKAKIVAFIHDLTPLLFSQFHVRSNVFLHQQRLRKMSQADAILANSEWTKRDIVEHLGIASQKIHVTPLAADNRFKPVEQELSAQIVQKYGISTPYLLFTGTWEPRKNLGTLIWAFERLKKERQIPHQLVLAGRKGWLYEDIVYQITHSPFRGEIRCADDVPDADLPSLMSGADVFVYPSFYEGFGLPVLESMQCGTPVVTSSVSSLPEVGGNACLYADPHSDKDLASKIQMLIEDPALRKNLSERGISRAKAFSWDRCARQTLEVYEKVVKE